jgi:hypothetical protein
VADDDLLPRHAEIAESFEQAELARTWREDSEHPDPGSLTGADLAAYTSWESATRTAWEEADRRVATEYDRLTALGLGQGPTRAGSEPVLPRNWAAADLWSNLRVLARPLDRDKTTLDIKALPEAWSAVRRNSRDLAGVLAVMRGAAVSSLSGATATAYNGSSVARQFDGFVNDAMIALSNWKTLITSSEDPGLDAMTKVAEDARTKLSYIRGHVDPMASAIERATGTTADQLPAPMTDGIIMYVAAVAEELGNQYAARVAAPSFGLMFERICEIPNRRAGPDPASPDFPNSQASAQRSKPEKALGLISARLNDMQGLTISDHQAQALVDAVKVTDFGSLGKSWDAWTKQLDSVPRQDMGVLKSSVSTLAFRLERLRAAVSGPFAQDPDLQGYALEPIDGLISLMQAQAEQAKALLR